MGARFYHKLRRCSTILKSAYNHYFNGLKTFNSVFHFNCDNKPLADLDRLDIVTIAFNNEEVIAQQIRLLKKFLLDPYCYTVADNSNDPNKQKRIMELCKEFQVGYIELPRNPYSRRAPSSSHGLALNWVYTNYIKPRRASFFGFIDHDIFPIKPTNIIKFLDDSSVFGLIQERGDFWYLWPGFCFFKYDLVRGAELNFMPCEKGDTGAGNWDALYARLDKNKVPYLKQEYEQLDNTNDDQVEYIGNWLHTSNASNWRKAQYIENRNNLVIQLLSKY